MTAYDPAAEALRARFGRQVDALHAAGYVIFDEAAAELGVARYTAQRMVADGRLRVERVDDRLVTKPAWIAQARPRVYRGGTLPADSAAAAWRREHGYLSVREAAEALGIEVPALRMRITRGAQKAVRAGADAPKPGSWLIRVEDVPGRAA